MVADASAEQAGGLWCQFHDRQGQPACDRTTLNCADWSGPPAPRVVCGALCDGEDRSQSGKGGAGGLCEEIWVATSPAPLLLCPPPRIMPVGRV
jgi:hypothetical protein